jgi:hypothetical protein
MDFIKNILFGIAYSFLCMGTFALGAVDNTAKHADDIGRIVIGRGNGVSRIALVHAGDIGKLISFHIDDVTKLTAFHADDFARMGLQHGDDIIYEFTTAHGKIIRYIYKATDVSSNVIIHTGDFARIILNNTADVVKSGAKTGGYFGELRQFIQKSTNQSGQLHIHHMPAFEAVNASNFSKLDYGSAPAIIMDKADHIKTSSFGYSENAIKYRLQQTELIKSGRIEDAIRMDINDLIKNGLYDKYKIGIDQMIQYITERGIINNLL